MLAIILDSKSVSLKAYFSAHQFTVASNRRLININHLLKKSGISVSSWLDSSSFIEWLTGCKMQKGNHWSRQILSPKHSKLQKKYVLICLLQVFIIESIKHKHLYSFSIKFPRWFTEKEGIHLASSCSLPSNNIILDCNITTRKSVKKSWWITIQITILLTLSSQTELFSGWPYGAGLTGHTNYPYQYATYLVWLPEGIRNKTILHSLYNSPNQLIYTSLTFRTHIYNKSVIFSCMSPAAWELYVYIVRMSPVITPVFYFNLSFILLIY